MKALRRLLRGRRPLILGTLGTVAFVLGFIGFRKLGLKQENWGDSIYRTIDLFSFSGGAGEGQPSILQLEIARWLAPVTTAWAALWALVAIFGEQATRLRVQMFADRHVLICGLGECGVRLARSFRESGDSVVAIEKDPANPAVGECKKLGITVVVGSGTDAALLDQVGVRRATALVSVCGDDAVNAAVATSALQLGREPGAGSLDLFVQIDDIELCRLLNERAMLSAGRADATVEFLNVYEGAAPALIAEFGGLSGDGQPHLVVVGIGWLGRRLVIQAAAHWRRLPAVGRPKLKITMIDPDASLNRVALSERYRGIDEVCSLRTIDGDPSSTDFVVDRAALDDATAVFVSLDDDARGWRAALALRRIVSGRSVPVVVCNFTRGGLAELMGAEASRGLHSFQVLDRVCTKATLLGGARERIARAIHESYVREQVSKGETPATNPSMVPWEELPETLRESNRHHAEDIGSKLAAIGCDIEPWTNWDAELLVLSHEEVELLAKAEHQRWWDDRVRDGWTPGPVKDVAAKKSPYLVPWDELSEEVRDLDRNPVRELPAFLNGVGFSVFRRGAP